MVWIEGRCYIGIVTSVWVAVYGPVNNREKNDEVKKTFFVFRDFECISWKYDI